MNRLFSHSCSIYSETYYINGLTANVYVPSYFNGVRDADTAYCKAVWTCLVRYVVL
jgi:hypothetical protein